MPSLCTGLLRVCAYLQVRVAFVAGGETMSLRQLSGGQKTLVALALIFAIQVRNSVMNGVVL